MVNALLSEIRMRSSELSSGALSSVYFGGGTPSLLLGDEISAILTLIRSEFDLDPEAEVTLEANPDDLSTDKLRSLHQSGVNRLSIGIQSFDDALLKLMNRAHNVEEANRCITEARSLGFRELSIDLIYGIPGSSMESWENDVDKAIQHRPKHISSYCLTIEKKTAFDHFISSGKMPAPSEELANQQYEMLCRKLGEAGYIHYEVSNFCLPGHEAKHNGSYWSGAEYLGVGPSAHSFIGNKRSWNIANNALYLKAIAKAEIPAESEDLSRADRINERIMTGLRTARGIDLEQMRYKLGFDLLKAYPAQIEEWLEKKWLQLDGNHLQPTEEGFLWSDHMSSELFFVEE